MISSRVREKIRTSPSGAVGLGADAVVLVFHQSVLEIAERLLRRFRRAGQHETQGMEQSHPRLGQLAGGGELQRLANVAQQHVGPLHFSERSAVGLGDCFLDQAFFQADSQVAGHDLDDVLGFERCGLREKVLYQCGFGGWAAGF